MIYNTLDPSGLPQNRSLRGVRQRVKVAAQVSTLNEIGEAVSRTINIDKIAALMKKSINDSGSKAGYMAIRQRKSPMPKVTAVHDN